MAVLSDNEINRVLAVSAHPDDVDFSSAGTIARWTDMGIEVTYLIVTDGDAGGYDDAVPRGSISGIRRAEQMAAAKAVGVSDVRWLGYPDGRVGATFDLRRDITRVIRQVRPERILTHSPERNYTFIYPSHPDHRAVGAATVDAVYPDARNPYAYPELRAEGLEAWTVREMWLHGGPSPHFPSDITDTVDRKIAALRSHTSQTSHMEDLDGFIRERFAQTARAFGLGDGRIAEVFQVVSTA